MNNIQNYNFALDEIFDWKLLFISAARFYEGEIENSFDFLIKSLKKLKIKLVILVGCSGDSFLRSVAQKKKFYM